MRPRLALTLIATLSLSALGACSGSESAPVSGSDATVEWAINDGSTSPDSDSGEAQDSAEADSACTPACSGRNCGDDGCGGSCGLCVDPCNDGVFAPQYCVDGLCDVPCSGISVTMNYAGSLSFVTFTALVYKDASCADLDGHALPSSALASEVVTKLEDRPFFAEIPAGTGYAVFVVAENGVDGLGFGCSDDIQVTAGQLEEVPVTIDAAPAVFNGLYLLDNRFDLTSSETPPSVKAFVDVMSEIADDHDLNNDDPNDGQYGEDPAAFLLDILFRQICCWEATGPSPDWDSCKDQDFTHAFGDLSALYLQDFTTWEGAQPKSDGLCGALEIANPLLQAELQELIQEHLPEIVAFSAAIGGEMAGIFKDAKISSELAVSGVYSKHEGEFSHELVAMTLVLHDLSGAPQPFEIDLAAAGLKAMSFTGTTHVEGDVLFIPPHAFSLDVGAVLAYVYEKGLLPLLGYESLEAMLGGWVDCAVIGAALEDKVDDLGYLDADDYEGFCLDGLEAASDWMADSISGVFDGHPEILLEGSVRGVNLDLWHVAGSLSNGVWDGVWQEDGYTSPFPGTFTGEQQ